MEFHPTRATKVTEELKDQSDAVEINLRRRILIQEGAERGIIVLFLKNIESDEPLFRILSKKEGIGVFFTKAVSPASAREFNYDEDYMVVEGLDESTESAGRLRLLTSSIIRYLEKFKFTNLAGTKIEIYDNIVDYKNRSHPVTSVNYPH